MDARKKMVELLDEAEEWADHKCDELDCETCPANKMKGNCVQQLMVDRLIAHGVTVQKWISVKDRLPTIYDADSDNCVLAIHKVSNKRYYHWRSVSDNPFDFTHWAKTPQPPKGE